MRRPLHHLLVLAVVVLAAVALAAGPAIAAPAGAATSVLAVEEPGTDEEAPAEGVPTTEEVDTEAQDGHKRPLPIDLTDPQGIFGAFLLLTMLAAAGLGLRNAIVQLRGERPQADGSWRWR